MKTRLNQWIIAGILIGTAACNSMDTTYADQKTKEREVIAAFLKRGLCVIDPEMGDTTLYVKPIKVITEAQFHAQDSTTDVSRNEYVLFSGSGVYMQIIEQGVGERLEEGKSATLLCRYVEYNLMGDSVQTRNNTLFYVASPDVMDCKNSYGTLTASFTSGVMPTTYGTTAVPSGWLIPLKYIRIGRQMAENERISKVRIIVPHSEGQAYATSSVYPCFYELRYQRKR